MDENEITANTQILQLVQYLMFVYPFVRERGGVSVINIMIAKIKKLSSEIDLPKYHTAESAGFDIAASEDITIKAKEIAKVPTGLIIESPHGYYLQLSARSSLGSKKGLQVINGIGVVDRDYSGPEDQIFIVVRNFTDQEVTVVKGERLAQGIFLPVQQVDWEEVSDIKKYSRGGVGSTGGYL